MYTLAPIRLKIDPMALFKNALEEYEQCIASCHTLKPMNAEKTTKPIAIANIVHNENESDRMSKYKLNVPPRKNTVLKIMSASALRDRFLLVK